MAWRKEEDPARKEPSGQAHVPTVRVRLVQSVCILPRQCTEVEANHWDTSPLLLERNPTIEEAMDIEMEDALLRPTRGGHALMVLSNPSGYTQVVERGTDLGVVTPATVIPPALQEVSEPVLPDVLPHEMTGNSGTEGIR